LSRVRGGDTVRARPIAMVPAAFLLLGVIAATWSRHRTTETAAKDELTGALNRRGFTVEFNRLISNRKDGVLMILDANQFKAINDQNGHEVGDEILKSIVRRARLSLPADALVARLGGDEFAVVLVEESDPKNRIAQLNCAIGEPLPEYPNVSCSVSIGYTLFNSSEELGDVMRRADQDMYAEKQRSQLRNIAPVTAKELHFA
jgi:diguanylate cyclase (GGDEF)-like protein